MEGLEEYLTGERLYGDDFTIEEIQPWLEDERTSYARLVAQSSTTYSYSYHALNCFHGFRYLPNRNWHSAAGIGSAYGEEFVPILKRIERLTIIEPCPDFRLEDLHGLPCKYLEPSTDGNIPCEDCSFDLILSLSVLHHIPKVTLAINEMYRCLTKGGHAVLREPITSMGDWSKPRRGLTKRERGIPAKWLKQTVLQAGFQIKHTSYFGFGVISRLCESIGIDAYRSTFLTGLDAAVCRILGPIGPYHRTRLLHRLTPSGVFHVLTKPK